MRPGILTRFLMLGSMVALTLPMISAAASAPEPSPQRKSDIRPLRDLGVWEAVAVAVMALGLALASAGGVGGGAIVVPMLVLALGFDIKFATPASNFIIFGGAIANALFNLRKRHPLDPSRPLVDPDICLAMIPAMMGGAVIGAVLSKLLPSYVISLLFIVLLTLSGVRVTQRAIRLHRLEQQRKAHEDGGSDDHQGEDLEVTVDDDKDPQDPTLVTSLHEIQTPKATKTVIDGCEQEDERRSDTPKRFMEEQASAVGKKHLLIVLCFLGIVAASVGGGRLGCGSVGYWVVLWAEIPWVLCFTVGFVIYMTRQRTRRLALQLPDLPGDLIWTTRVIVGFPAGCMFAGLVAGLFGIGGAVVSGPLMIEMGVLPEVASSTSALLVLYSSAAATAKFALFNRIVWDWSILMCGIAFVVTIVSQIYILGFVRRTGRQSIIVFCIAFTICVGGALMIYTVAKSLKKDIRKPFSINFCSSYS